MDSTLLTIAVILVFATVIALVQARRRDRCLKSFSDFRITLAEQDGDLTWGHMELYPTGIEILYDSPAANEEGYSEASFLFFKEQYEAIDALYRYSEGLTTEEQERRRKVIEQTRNPSFIRRLRRKLRNWIGMVRDALMQAVTVAIGAAKAQRPGGVVLGTQEAQIKALSSEVIGHTGNAFDPLLEEHLFRRVVVEVTRSGVTWNYCGLLKDYTSQFLELVDARPARGAAKDHRQLRPGTTGEYGVRVAMESGKVIVRNEGKQICYVDHIVADDWRREMHVVLAPGFGADLRLPAPIDSEAVEVTVGPVESIDMVVPRRHAIVRHAVAEEGWVA